ncbi:hypothetical protein BUALT_Bualt04G0091600 [Buddleja alternifolia]|uniref:Uncharacterized protein n=1 Tax=Buddleja alternifolia TaxID=168488 RepID=A0AAV6XNW1_9LAMI|nr:hypothetical protein BUALT_Bualt04G0091600 [Buddleja alternifolia]
MGGDVVHRRSSYLSGCMSPSCVPVHEEYSRIHHISQDKSHRSRRLRRLLRKIVNESKIGIYGPAKRLSFQYDAVSYSQNFDDGSHRDHDDYARCHQVLHDFSYEEFTFPLVDFDVPQMIDYR